MEVTLIYPNQLFSTTEHPALAPDRPVYLVEEALILTHNPVHRAKLVLHRMTMQAYADTLRESGYDVRYIDIQTYPTTESVFDRLQVDRASTIHVVDTTDDYLEQALTGASASHNLRRVRYESPLFLLPREAAMSRYTKSRRHMANFYKKLRQDTGILMDGDDPLGGAWSFDSENRHKLPKGHVPPADIELYPTSPAFEEAVTWTKTLTAEMYGDAVHYLPTTHAEARAFFDTFLAERFVDFGPYEDAIDTTHTRLYHSLLSPLLNIGLLTPRYIVDTTLSYAKKHTVPIASLEGFIRQIIGWREFIRASYEVDGRMMRSKNFFKNTHTLSDAWWNGTTGIDPLDTTVARALRYGYTHHIERLMVAGNLMLLSGIHPTEVYRWFMGMYIDAYDWVMVPNVYGMSQFADGGSFATKPYISGAAYIKKMSNYAKGDWEAAWTALYWHFIARHQDVFEKNHRLSMMPRLWAKMSPDTQKSHSAKATAWLTSLKAEDASTLQ
jgi:deoxyribodipyrimidine photolyase-related protein